MASHKLSSRHSDCPDFDDSFNCKQAIGKLLFMEKSNLPDPSYAVHQCARFSHAPKQIHGEAVKRIGRYLKGTPDKGLIAMAGSVEELNPHVDASFAGV